MTQEILLGQLYGLIMDKCVIFGNRITFSTTKPNEAKTYVHLMKRVLNIEPQKFIYYLEDVTFSNTESAIKYFETHLPKLRKNRIRIFQRPNSSKKPRLTIICEDKNIISLLSSFVKHLQILQKNIEFSKGFIMAILRNAKISEKGEGLSIAYNDISPYLINSLEIINADYTQEDAHITIRKHSIPKMPTEQSAVQVDSNNIAA